MLTSMDCTDLQFFRCYRPRCCVRSCMHLGLLYISDVSAWATPGIQTPALLHVCLITFWEAHSREIAGFRCGWTEFFRLLGYYTAWDGLKLTLWDYLSVLSSRVKKSFKMGSMGSPETSVSKPITPRNNPENGRKLTLVPRSQEIYRFL